MYVLGCGPQTVSGATEGKICIFAYVMRGWALNWNSINEHGLRNVEYCVLERALRTTESTSSKSENLGYYVWVLPFLAVFVLNMLILVQITVWQYLQISLLLQFGSSKLF